ncbi:hypothetical protein L1987_20066 [Smallanthus sonchifolius]|uniref:Uncharacterized protein n=1 Tax=Smallanthus sonchifolius TaxID=185202 RepID=A0ACB9IR83_9ASTR|nr:hypothetical protein L1987_20066 [Smallanthus sonchifolius]
MRNWKWVCTSGTQKERREWNTDVIRRKWWIKEGETRRLRTTVLDKYVARLCHAQARSCRPKLSTHSNTHNQGGVLLTGNDEKISGGSGLRWRESVNGGGGS